MSQVKYEASVANKEAADALVAKTENLAGVLFVNVNLETNTIVVTYGEGYDEAAFKAAAGI